jgi:tetratricopeptide (TPR) repeat protein
MRVGEVDGAAANYDEAVAAARRLAELDGGNTQRQSELWETLYKLGQAKLGTGNRSAAEDLFAQALMIIRGLTAKDPSNVNWQTNLVVNLYRIASLQDGPGRIQTLNEALEILQQLRDTGHLTADKIGWPDAIAQMLAPKL